MKGLHRRSRRKQEKILTAAENDELAKWATELAARWQSEDQSAIYRAATEPTQAYRPLMTLGAEFRSGGREL